MNVEDDEVTLTGTVRSIFEAEKAVPNTFESGAKAVRERFKLVDGSEFHHSAVIESEGIKVACSDGKVTLSGTVSASNSEHNTMFKQLPLLSNI